jgi:hypothetical protein
VIPKELIPKPCAQPRREQRQPDNPGDHRHGRTFRVRDRPTGPSTPPRSYHLSLCIAKSVSSRVGKPTPRVFGRLGIRATAFHMMLEPRHAGAAVSAHGRPAGAR